MLTKDIMDAFAGEMTPKFLATIGPQDVPNVVPIISLTAPDPETLIFGEFMIQKTRRNLEASTKVSAMVVTDDLEVWTVRGDFEKFATTGPFLDKLNQSKMFRYNAYMGISRAGVIKVKDVTSHARLSKAALLMDLAAVQIGRRVSGPGNGAATAMPAQVLEKFSRVKAVRAFSYLDRDGYPDTRLFMAMMPSGDRSLVFAPWQFADLLGSLQRDAPVAASIITFDPVAYQVKGTWQGLKRRLGFNLASMNITEVYSACPPLPGKRIA